MEKTISKSNIKMMLFSLIIAFLLGIISRTMIIATSDNKIVLHKTFETSYVTEVITSLEN